MVCGVGVGDTGLSSLLGVLIWGSTDLSSRLRSVMQSFMCGLEFATPACKPQFLHLENEAHMSLAPTALRGAVIPGPVWGSLACLHT